MEINAVYQGFKLIREEMIDDIKSLVREFEHEKTGAKLFHFDNEDTNKYFSAAFKTPPVDNTGIAHIMEHSVLCGSAKYPSKEPFVELLKGSLNTFLNAFTASDFTTYPVASTNDKDFFNLVSVYLDAVFYPNIYLLQEILMQEGWHYEIDPDTNELIYNGVVYNEMKGALSSPLRKLSKTIDRSLFTENCYRFESGGDPDHIPEITQEMFLDFHKKYYHPSNGFLFLYGKMDLEAMLTFINDEYLSKFEKRNDNIHTEKQLNLPEQKLLTEYYSLSDDEKEDEKDYISINYLLNIKDDPIKMLGLTVLEYMLYETPASPLRQAIVDSKLGKDTFCSFNTSMIQPHISFILKDTDAQRAPQFEELLLSEINKLITNGFDKELLESSLNFIEFQLREADTQSTPKGFIYMQQTLNYCIYGLDPFQNLKYVKFLEHIKEQKEHGFFENLLKEIIPKNDFKTTVILKPKKNMVNEMQSRTQEKLQQYKDSLSEKQIQDIMDTAELLKLRQITPDSPEVLATIPALTLHDITPEAEYIGFEEKTLSGKQCVFYPQDTNGIVYSSIFFETKHLDTDELFYLSILSDVMGKISTENMHYSKLSNEINTHTGGVGFELKSYSHKDDADAYAPKFIIASKVLVDRLPDLVDIILEVVNKTVFTDTERIKDIIQEEKSGYDMHIMQSGYGMAITRLMSYYSKSAKFNDVINGFTFYTKLKHLEENFDTLKDDLVIKLKQVSTKLFNAHNVLISASCENENYPLFEKSFARLIENLQDIPVEYKEFDLPVETTNEGFYIPGRVQYVFKGCNFKKLGFEYSGKMQVLDNILNLDYLWIKIRVQGGAYGPMSSFRRNGNFYVGSYRDPNLIDSLDIYDKIPEYLKILELSDEELTKYVIGTIAKFDQPMTPSMKADQSITNYLIGTSKEDVQKLRDDILATTAEDMTGYHVLLAEALKNSFICVLGSEEKIKTNKDIFQNIIGILE